MKDLSVVILSKNVAHSIEAAISSALQVSKDVIVVDSGSTDATLAIASKFNARILHITWNGYGNARNSGSEFAQHDFILNIDADEIITKELAYSINELKPKEGTIYGFVRNNFLGKKKICYGEWSGDTVFRIYNKNKTSWDGELVHEKIIDTGFEKKIISGRLLHFTAPDIETYNIKLDNYSLLFAKKYYEQGKAFSETKMVISPVFNFVKNYFLKLGFIDGKAGWQIAKAHYRYNKKKYKNFKRLKSGK